MTKKGAWSNLNPPSTPTALRPIQRGVDHPSTPYSSREHLTVKIYRAILLILYVCIPLHFNKSIICPWHFFFEIFFFVFLGFGPLPGP